MPQSFWSRAYRDGGQSRTLRPLSASLLVALAFVTPTVYFFFQPSASSSTLLSGQLPSFGPSSFPKYEGLSLSQPGLPVRQDNSRIAAMLRGNSEVSGQNVSDVQTVSHGMEIKFAKSLDEPRTLVIYVYHESQEWYRENLRFFIRVAMQDNDNNSTDYLLVINGISDLPLRGLLASTLAQREGRVWVLQRANTCYDGGTVGEVLRTHPHLAESYFYYVLMNSSVRGPFLPRYFQRIKGEEGHAEPRRRSWTSPLTSLLNDEVKLAGTTLSCMGQVHVQSMVLATDRIGLKVLLGDGVLNCASTLSDAIRTYEMGASTAILNAGYNVDSLMTRYTGVDWRQKRDLYCNAGMNPQGEHMNDGLGLDPFEVVFVKAKEFPRVAATQAFLRRYTEYYMDRDDLVSNDFMSPRLQAALKEEKEALRERVLRCQATFDAEFYFTQNPDLKGAVKEADAERHFYEYGFFERRPYHFIKESAGERDGCPFD